MVTRDSRGYIRDIGFVRVISTLRWGSGFRVLELHA